MRGHGMAGKEVNMKQYQLIVSEGELTLLRQAVIRAEKAYRQDEDPFNSLLMNNAEILLESKVKEAKNNEVSRVER